MDNNSDEIELGNGYGFFCNIHDIESQQPVVKPILKPKYTSRRRYLEKIKKNEDPPDDDNNYAMYAISLIAFIVTICIFVI